MEMDREVAISYTTPLGVASWPRDCSEGCARFRRSVGGEQ